MDIAVTQLPSGGIGYNFPTIKIKPLNFMEVVQYVDNAPKDDPLGKYLYDLEMVMKDDDNIRNCYIMDVDFLIFYKKLCTVSEDLTYKLDIKCPNCGKSIKKTISFEHDIRFKQIDPKIMRGSKIILNNNRYDTILPTVDDFLKVFSLYLRYRKITDIKMIKTIALIKGFDTQANNIERDVLEATHSDITLLMALRDLYYDRLEPITFNCPECEKNGGERSEVAVSVESLIVDFFRDLFINSPIDAAKIIFK